MGRDQVAFLGLWLLVGVVLEHCLRGPGRRVGDFPGSHPLFRRFRSVGIGYRVAWRWPASHRVSVRSMAEGMDLAAGTALAGQPFVGRARQLELLAEVFAGASAGRPRVVLVEGEAGIGKSALLARATAGLADGQAVLLRARAHRPAAQAHAPGQRTAPPPWWRWLRNGSAPRDTSRSRAVPTTSRCRPRQCEGDEHC